MGDSSNLIFDPFGQTIAPAAVNDIGELVFDLCYKDAPVGSEASDGPDDSAVKHITISLPLQFKREDAVGFSESLASALDRAIGLVVILSNYGDSKSGMERRFRLEPSQQF